MIFCWEAYADVPVLSKFQDLVNGDNKITFIGTRYRSENNEDARGESERMNDH